MRYAVVGGLMLAVAGVCATPSRVEACGGCFHPPTPPGESQQVVTDHRMVFAVHADETILWDQIRYAGAPSEFAWVLPVWGDVQVETASASFFDELDAATAPRVLPPPPQYRCGDTIGGGGGGGIGCGSASDIAAPNRGYAASDAGASGGGDHVTVIHQETVGPYETVTLRSDDTGALTQWLTDHHYTVPPSIQPIIDAYNRQHMDFVALRLQPGEGVQAMTPIRIRYRTANMVLPLRMVSAGVAEKVGISLWVFGLGRYETANFTSGEIALRELVWDWNTNHSNYPEVFESTLQRLANGRAWITEFADLRTAIQVPVAAASQPDWDLAVGSSSEAWVTRLRTDLAANFLDSDLVLQASTNTARVSATLQAAHETGTNPSSACAQGAAVVTRDDVVRSPLRTLSAVLFGLVTVAAARRRRKH